MKKFFVLAMLIALPLALGGCFKQAAAPSGEAQPSAGGGIKVGEPNTIMGWIKSGKGVECSFVSPEGDRISVLAQGEKVKMSGFPYASISDPSAPAEAGFSLSDGEWMYMWGSSGGTKMNIARLSEMAEETGNVPDGQPETWEDMISSWDGANVDYDCQEKRVPDSEFMPPEGIEFFDLTAMFEGMAEIGRELEASLDNGEPFDPALFEGHAEELRAIDAQEEDPDNAE